MLKLQTIFFILFLQFVPLFTIQHSPHLSIHSSNFFEDFLEFSSVFPNEDAFLKDLMLVIKEFTNEISEEMKENQQRYEKKAYEKEDLLDSLQNRSEILEYEIKCLTKHIYMLEEEIESNGEELEKLLRSKQQIIDMKINESELFHAKLKEKTNFDKDFIELLEALKLSYTGIKSLLAKDVNNREELVEKRMTLGKIKAKKKTMKNMNLMNFLLLNEPFLAVAINSDLTNRDTIMKIVRRLEEMIKGLEGNHQGVDSDLRVLNESYKKRVETLYKEYEGIMEEISLFEDARQKNQGFLLEKMSFLKPKLFRKEGEMFKGKNHKKRESRGIT